MGFFKGARRGQDGEGCSVGNGSRKSRRSRNSAGSSKKKGFFRSNKNKVNQSNHSNDNGMMGEVIIPSNGLYRPQGEQEDMGYQEHAYQYQTAPMHHQDFVEVTTDFTSTEMTSASYDPYNRTSPPTPFSNRTKAKNGSHRINNPMKERAVNGCYAQHYLRPQQSQEYFEDYSDVDYSYRPLDIPSDTVSALGEDDTLCSSRTEGKKSGLASLLSGVTNVVAGRPRSYSDDDTRDIVSRRLRESNEATNSMGRIRSHSEDDTHKIISNRLQKYDVQGGHAGRHHRSRSMDMNQQSKFRGAQRHASMDTKKTNLLNTKSPHVAPSAMTWSRVKEDVKPSTPIIKRSESENECRCTTPAASGGGIFGSWFGSTHHTSCDKCNKKNHKINDHSLDDHSSSNGGGYSFWGLFGTTNANKEAVKDRRKQLQQSESTRALLEQMEHENPVNIFFLARTKQFKSMCDWAFDFCDSDKSGDIDEQELYTGLLLIHLKLGSYVGPAACKYVSQKESTDVFKKFDVDGNGTLDREEFRKVMMVLFSNVLLRVAVQFALTLLIVPIMAKIVLDFFLWSTCGIWSLIISWIWNSFYQSPKFQFLLSSYYMLFAQMDDVSMFIDWTVTSKPSIIKAAQFRFSKILYAIIPKAFWATLPLTFVSAVLGVMVVPFILLKLDAYVQKRAELKRKEAKRKKRKRQGLITNKADRRRK